MPKKTSLDLGETAAMIFDIFPKATKKQKAAVFDVFLNKFKAETIKAHENENPVCPTCSMTFKWWTASTNVCPKCYWGRG